MFRRISKSVSIAIKAAFISFEKSYIRNEDLESILGYRDGLTNILNRKAFERDKKRFKQGWALVIIDIDNFKNINDTRGHVAGDIVLKRLAGILAEQACPGGIPYRIGGDEFVLIVPKSKVNSICNAIRRNIRAEDSFTVSQGVVLDTGPEAIDKQMHLADMALYESKRNGKNRTTVHTPALA